MTMGLKSRRLIGSKVEAKIMYYSFLFIFFLSFVILNRCAYLGKAGLWV